MKTPPLQICKAIISVDLQKAWWRRIYKRQNCYVNIFFTVYQLNLFIKTLRDVRASARFRVFKLWKRLSKSLEVYMGEIYRISDTLWPSGKGFQKALKYIYMGEIYRI